MSMVDCGAKIFSSLDTCFKEDALIDEYDFVAVPSSLQRESAVWVVGHKLAIESGAVKSLYLYAYGLIRSWRSTKVQRSEADLPDIRSITRAVLLVNAEHMTAWNIRKELLGDKILQVDEEIQFTDLILRKHPKSPETFSHRKWLLRKMADDGMCNVSPGDRSLSEAPRCSVNREMQTCRKAAENYRNNYSAWSHRIWAIQLTHADFDAEFLHEELEASRDFVDSNVSDHSGLHYRQFLLARVYDSSDLQKTLQSLSGELQWNADLIRRYEGHEALWCHRRFLLHRGINLHAAKTGEDNSEVTGAFQTVIAGEDNFCSIILQQSASRTSSSADWQATLVHNHRRWLDMNIILT